MSRINRREAIGTLIIDYGANERGYSEAFFQNIN